MNIIVAAIGDFVHGIGAAFSLFGSVWYFLLPPILYPIVKTLWMDHIQKRYASSLNFVLLEIIPPTIGAAMRFITLAPVPLPQRIGSKPAMIAVTVIILGRTRSTAPSMTAL